jgi:hypothetical protein
MRQLAALSLCLFVGLVLASHLACNQSSYPSSSYGGGMYPMATPTPTTAPPACPSCTPTPMTIYYGGAFNYSLTMSGPTITNPVTVAVNQKVIFDSSLTGHPLYVDNGSTCLVSNAMTFPVTFTPPSAANYLAHCGLHGSCTTSCPAASCTGMAFTIHAQ